VADALGTDGIRAEAHANRGNALRLLSRFQEARSEFYLAQELIAGRDDFQPRCRVLELSASFLTAVRDYGAALDLLSAAGQVHRRSGDSAALGSVLVQAGIAQGYLGQAATAVRTLTEAAPLVRTRSLNLALCSAMSVNLLEAGFLFESEEVYVNLRRLLASEGDFLAHLRAEWLGARIDAARERFSVAAVRFADIRAEYEQRDMHYESGLAGLEHALALAHSGRTADALPLLTSVDALLSAMGVEPEARAARMLGQALSCVAVETVRAALVSLRNHPLLAAA
jgi:tetratricopeptide (TPR) repeat protein